MFIELSFLYNLSITKYKSFNLITFSTPDNDSIESLYVVRKQDRFAISPQEWWCFLITEIHPFSPYMFVDSLGLSPGYYYYYTFFTKLKNNVLMKDTIKVHSPAPPQLVSVSPVPGVSDGRIFKMAFNSQIDSSSFFNGTSIFSYGYSDTIYYMKRNIKINKDSVFISLTPIPRSNDNLIFYINSDLVCDIFGNKIDGNWNTFEDGTPDDDIYLNYRIAPLGDFNLDYEVNTSDFAIFKNAFLNNDTFYETGPYYGNLPDIYCKPDGLMNYEDFNAFCVIWRWFLKNRKIFVDKSVGSNIIIDENNIITNADGFLELASLSELKINKAINLKGFKSDTNVIVIEVSKDEIIKYNGKVISYRLIDKNGYIICSGNKTIFRNDSLILDIIGRKNYKLKKGIYFILKEKVSRKIIKIK